MTLSIRAKITVGTVVAVTVGLLAAGWLTLRAVTEFELARVTKDLQARAALMSGPVQRVLHEGEAPGARDRLRTKVRELARQAQARVSIILPDGRVLADSGDADEPDRLADITRRPEVVAALEKGVGTTVRTSDADGGRLLHVAVRLEHDSGIAGILRATLPLTTLEQNTSALERSLFIALGVGFFCTLLLSPLLARSLTRPLSEMVTVAQQLADGELNQRLPEREPDEVGLLAATLNRMADRLERTIKEVSEDRAQLRATLFAMVEGVMVLDAQGTVLQINPALERMLLTPGTKARGRSHREVIRHHELNELVNRILAVRENANAEITLAPSGRTFQMEASVAGWGAPSEACAVLVFHDVTALRRLENVRKDFVANVSHELRTPLTSIHGYALALKDGGLDAPDQAGRFVDVILKQSERLNLILDDLLQLSQIESGEVVFKQEPVFLPSLIERSIAVIKPQATRKSQTLTVTIAADLPATLGDEERLVQVLTNLLDNAVKYTPERGTITIDARAVMDPDPQGIKLVVSDSGIGIPEADRPRIFERFYRVDKARSRELGGTGLGLSIVKHIVERHEGQVWVEGNQPTGTRFVVRLPTAPAKVSREGDAHADQ